MALGKIEAFVANIEFDITNCAAEIFYTAKLAAIVERYSALQPAAAEIAAVELALAVKVELTDKKLLLEVLFFS